MTVRDGMDVLVVGGGRMGTALGTLIAKNRKSVKLWVRNEAVANEINDQHTNSGSLPDVSLPETLVATTNLTDSIKKAPVVIMAVPSQAFRTVAHAVGDALEGDQIIVHTTKGFEVDTFKRMSQILREETCTLKIGALSGPTIAKELVAGHPSGALVASGFDEVITRFQMLFEGTYFRVYGGRDVVGTEIAGAFKNVIAVAAGAVGSMGFGDNTKWLLATRGLNEMSRLGVAMGAQVLTFGGLAGIGDLAATCASPHSLSQQFGARIAEGKKSVEEIAEEMPGAIEAIPTSLAIHKHSSRLGLKLSIVPAVHGLLHEGWSIGECLEKLMSVPVGDEVDGFPSR